MERRPADGEGSFERLYRIHRADVYRALLRELGNREDAEDVTQSAFLDAYRALARGNEPERPRAWLFTIAENAGRRRLRRLRRGPDQTELEREPPADEVAVTVRELREALELLPANQRATLVLREVGGFSYAEIAARLDLSVAAVQMLLFRARRTLRAEFATERTHRRVSGWLPWPLQPWLGDLSAAHGPAGLASRAGGIAAAGLLGAAVVVGAGSLPGARAVAEPRPAPVQSEAPPPARSAPGGEAPVERAAPPKWAPAGGRIPARTTRSTTRARSAPPPAAGPAAPPAAPVPAPTAVRPVAEPQRPPRPARLLPLPAQVVPEIAPPIIPPLVPPLVVGAPVAPPELQVPDAPLLPAVPGIAVPSAPAPPAGTGDQGGALTGFPTS